MSDDQDESSSDCLKAKHRKEKKELQAQIVALKKTNIKKKQLTEQIQKLEKDLEEKHKEELSVLQSESSVTTESEVSANHSSADVVSVTKEDDSDLTNPALSNGKVSRAQKRRDQKSEKQARLAAAAQEDTKQAGTSKKAIETLAIRKKLKSMQLRLHETIDGDELRVLCASYMREHSDDFLPFLSDPNTGDALHPSKYDKYCDQVQGKHGPVWGGQPELRALSLCLERAIDVVQADADTQRIGTEYEHDHKLQPLVVCFHRYMYRLGEHYNSTLPFDPNEEEEV